MFIKFNINYCAVALLDLDINEKCKKENNNSRRRKKLT